MLGLPHSTEINRRIAKDKFYTNLPSSQKLRDRIKEQIESIVWRNKLADSTMGISAGDNIEEIQVFELQLRQKELDKRVLTAISKAIPYKILFVLICDNEAQAWIEVSGTFYNTDWKLIDEIALKFEGLNLDVVYENLARQIAGGRLGLDGDIDEAVEHDKQRQKLERDIVVFEKKLASEKQFNRQVELNGELKRIRKELEGLG